MSSLKEKMKSLKRIIINHDEECVIEVHYKGTPVADLLFSIGDIEMRLSDGKANVKTCVTNPNGFGEHEITTIKYSID